jgi:hypothetical protein
MRIVVDTMPKNASDCLFARYSDSGIMCCTLKRNISCPLESNLKCENLLPMNGVEFIVKQQVKYGR